LKLYLNFQNHNRKESNMTIDLQQYAPAALATEPRTGLSSKYSFLPTRAVLDALAEDGWVAVDCKQTWGRRGGFSTSGKHQFARRAIELRHAGSEGVVAIEDILTPVRKEDAGNSLWVRFNVAQEKLLKGAYPVYHRSKNDWSVRDARPIRSIDESSKLNTGLWALAEQFSVN